MYNHPDKTTMFWWPDGGCLVSVFQLTCYTIYSDCRLQIPSALSWDLVSLTKTSLYPSGLAGLETVLDLCLLTKRWEVFVLFALFLSSTAVFPFQSSNLSNFTRKSDAMTLITPQTEVMGWSTPLTGSPVSQSIKSRTYQGKIKKMLRTI